MLQVENNDKNLIFLDEVRFSVVSRPKKSRNKKGESAYISVSAARSRNSAPMIVGNRRSPARVGTISFAACLLLTHAQAGILFSNCIFVLQDFF